MDFGATAPTYSRMGVLACGRGGKDPERRGWFVSDCFCWVFGVLAVPSSLLSFIAGVSARCHNRETANQQKDALMSHATGAETSRQTQELHIFHDVAKALTSSLDLDSILQTIMEKMAEYFRPDTWSLLMVDEQKNELYFAIAVGTASETLKNVRLKVGEGIAGWVAKHGERLIVPDVYTDPRFAKRIDEMTKLETRSIICVPLRSKLRVLGVIQLVNVHMEHFTDQETFFLQSLCDYAAIAIENARSVEKIQELTITDRARIFNRDC